MKKRILMALLAVAVLMMDIQMVHAEEMVAAPEETAEVEAAGAEGEHVSSDGFTFTLDSTYYATITGYNGKETDIVVPAKVYENDKEYIVIGVNHLADSGNTSITSVTVSEGILNIAGAFTGLKGLKVVNLPSSLASVQDESFNNSTSLTAINVAEGGKIYFSRNGVLMYHYEDPKNHAKRIELQVYPAGKENTEYVVDPDVAMIRRASFQRCQHLEKLTIPNNVWGLSSLAINTSAKPLTVYFQPDTLEKIEFFATDAFYALPAESKIIVKNNAVAAEMANYLQKCDGTQIISLENDPSYRKAATDLRFTADESNTKNMIIGVGDVDTRLRTSYMISPADTTDNVTWEVVEGENIAKVDPVSGCITGLEPGTCRIEGKIQNNDTVKPLVVNLMVHRKISSTELMYTTDHMESGQKEPYIYAALDVKPYDANFRDKVQWTSSNTDVATVVSTGGDEFSAGDVQNGYYENGAKITVKAPGTTTITATIDDNGTPHVDSFVVNVTKPLVNVDTLSISSIKAQTYTGKAITPAITVKDGSKVLKSGTDYTVTYTNNVNPGTAAVTIKGIGSYTGERSVSFKIEKKNSGSAAKQISKTTISGIKTKTYTGKAITQAVTVRDGSKVLKAGTDYTVSYKGNKNAGKASVIITGKNGYTGSVTKYFTIRKADQKIKAASSYKKPYGSKAFTVSAKRTAGKGKLTYKSSDKKVAAVNGKGKVAIKGTGIAVITVTAEGNTNYNKKAVKITITSAPKQEKLVTVKSRSKKKLEVKWSKDTRATGYEVQYSTSSKFKSKTTKTVQIRKNKTTGQTIKKLKSGKKYYVRVRAYKKCGKKKLCGQWSKAKNVKIR